MADKWRPATSADVIDMFGDRRICDRCGANVSTYGDKCQADLDERCAGFDAYDLMVLAAQSKINEATQ